ncbi:MAG: hypothetical protein KDD36_12400 [Flavobacteriales bacterium]|nr:hypothetical protein [Flavobacteriales bacterium]
MTKQVLNDTTIQGKTFQKIRWTKFKDIDGAKTNYYEYEHLADKELILLDQNFQTIHNLKLIAKLDQQGIIFGKQGKIKSEYIDLRRSYPRDSLVPDDRTPIKFFIDDNCKYALTYRPELNVIELADNCKSSTKYCLGEVFKDLTKGLENTTPINSNFELTKGDEVQLHYRRRFYNDTTRLAEFEKKQIITMVYDGDTIIDKQKQLMITYNDYNFLSGRTKEPQTVFVTMTDSGFYMNGQQFIPTKNFKPVFKIDSLKMDESKIPKEYLDEYRKEAKKKFITFSAYVYDTLGGVAFPRVVFQQSNSPYTNYVLPYFPVMYNIFPGIDGVITYIKKGNKQYGTKLEPEVKTDETNIRKIKCLSKKEVQLDIYFTETCDVTVLIYDKNEKTKPIHKTQITTTGLQTITVKTPKLKRGEYYQIQVEYKKDNNTGVLTTGFTANYK